MKSKKEEKISLSEVLKENAGRKRNGISNRQLYTTFIPPLIQ